MGRPRAATGLLLAGLAACVACGPEGAPSPTRGPPPVEPPSSTVVRPPSRYVGASACAGCHPEPSEAWRGSHHDLAMAEASEGSVLGDFGGATLERHGERFTFQRRDGRFLVRTAGPDGEPAEFEVAYTFGVEPLQQYLVRLPRGRLQALAAAWDTRPAARGGQRWLHLHPGEPVPPGDPLHWTGLAGRWNALCAECHSTNVDRGYRPEEDAYTTTFSEVDVACEACHGPGSAHVAWADGRTRGGREAPGYALVAPTPRYDPAAWTLAPGAAIAERRAPPAGRPELEVCAPCHSRRTALHRAGGRAAPLLDTHRPALLEEGLYYADGQIQDEVYVWGSFLQSRMFAAGVTCSDCHDAHSLELRAEGNALCGRCHLPARYDDPEHHHHAPRSAGASCVACHMLARTYMVVDVRHDHGFRVPRPALGIALDAPDACSDCHADRPRAWSAEAIERWYGAGRGSGRSFAPHYGEALHAARTGAPRAAAALAALARNASQPAIARATALELLGRQPAGPEAAAAIRAGLRDPAALVRMASAGAGEALPPAERVRALEPLLRDPRRAVRIEAARALAPLRGQVAATGGERALEAALAEYQAAQELQADRPESHVNLGLLHAEVGELEAAEREYLTALRLWPFFVPARANLADLYRAGGRDADGERVLREGLERVPDSAPLEHALGLLLVRGRRLDEALSALRRAAELAPETARYAYVYGVALHSAGEPHRALAVLEAALREHAGDADLLAALATLHRDAGEVEAARAYARELLAVRPDDPGALALLRELELPKRR